MPSLARSRQLLLIGILFLCAPFAHGIGVCPTATNYIDLTAPQNGGGLGSLALSATNAGGITSGCWFFSSSGSDANTCTTEASPCQFLPGMPNCASTCAGITPASGQGFIIQGGSVYHRSSGTPLIGGAWTWSQSGISSNYIYIGIDPTWFSGGSFARPVLNQDNPLSTSIVGSCSFADDGTALMTVSGSFVIVDGLEGTGNCLSGSGVDSVFAPSASKNQVFERDYVHGWTSTSGVLDDAGVKFGPNNVGNGHEGTDRFLFDVVDGADSTNGASCQTPSCVASGTASGWAFEYCWDVEFTVIHHTSNGLECGDTGIVHDDDFQYLFEPTLSGRHGNINETVFANICTTGYWYNNVFGNLDEGNGVVIQCQTFYLFNNVMFNDQHFPPDANAFNLAGPDLGTCPGANSVITVYFYNNTIQDGKMQGGPCQTNNEGGWAVGSTINFENDHLMDFTTLASFFSCDSGNSCTVTDNGGESFMTTTLANTDGYSNTNFWSPTLLTSPTVGAGNNNTTFCASIPNANAAAACASGTGGVSEISLWGGLFASYPRITVNARPASGSWNAGAYQFSAAVVTPAPALGMFADILKGCYLCSDIY